MTKFGNIHWQYSKEELLHVIEEAGFKVDRLRYAPGMPNRHFNLQLSIDKSS